MPPPTFQDDHSAEMPECVMQLSEGQRRNLLTVLRRVERAAWYVEEHMRQETHADLALTLFTGTPNALQAEAFLLLASLLRQKVVQLALECGLERKEESYLQAVKATFTLLWADLEDARPEKLQRYGAEHPRTEAWLGPRLQEVIELVLTLNGIADSTRDAQQVLHAHDWSNDEPIQSETREDEPVNTLISSQETEREQT